MEVKKAKASPPPHTGPALRFDRNKDSRLAETRFEPCVVIAFGVWLGLCAPETNHTIDEEFHALPSAVTIYGEPESRRFPMDISRSHS